MSYFLDDSFYGEDGEYYHLPHFVGFKLDVETDIELLKRIEALNYRLSGIKAISTYPRPHP